MEPRGKVKELIDKMDAQPEKGLWCSAEVADAMGVPCQGLAARLGAALRNGWIYKHELEGRKVAYSRQAPEAEQEKFAAGLWTDGEMVLRGLQPNEDGSILLTADQVAQVRALLTGQTVAA